MDPVADLVEAVLQLAGLTEQTGSFALPDDTCPDAPAAVAAVCAALDVPLAFTAASTGRGRDFAAVALAAELRRAQAAPGLAAAAPAAVAERCRALAAADAAGLYRLALPGPAAALATTTTTGPGSGPGVIVSAPSGMGDRLALPWLRELAATHRCAVVQARGTTGRITDPLAFDRDGHGFDEQVADLVAVAERFGPGVHVMGLCAGAAVALAAAAARPDVVDSLSLWHADLQLPGTATTDHQQNLRALLDLGSESRETAAWLRAKLTSGPMTGVPGGIGPLVVRPYATDELFYRYARLTAAAMHHDPTADAAAVAVPALVVTSRDDSLAHPDGSRAVAELIPGSRLVLTDHGEHLDAFRATAAQTGLLRELLARAGTVAARSSR